MTFQAPAALEPQSPKTLAQQVRHLDEKGSAVAPEAWFKISGERIETVPIQIVVVSDIEGRAWVRRPTEEKLSANV